MPEDTPLTAAIPVGAFYISVSIAIERWKHSGQTFIERALNVGEALNNLKANIPYGDYGALEEKLAKEHQVSCRTLRNYARAAELVSLGTVSRDDAIAIGLRAVLSSAPKEKALTARSSETVAKVAEGREEKCLKDVAAVSALELELNSEVADAGQNGAEPLKPPPMTTDADRVTRITELEAEVLQLWRENDRLQASIASLEAGHFIPADVAAELLAMARALLPEKGLKTADDYEADAQRDKSNASKHRLRATAIRFYDRLLAALS